MSTHTENSQNTQKDLDNYIISGWEDENLNLSANLLRGIYAFGFEKPSSIQCQTLMPMTSTQNRDIIAQAQSGTGKTGAFVISVLHKLCNANYEKLDNTFALILAPTHELASQSMKVFSVISKFMKPEVRIELLVGGTSIEDSKNKLIKNKPHIVVGTPGRIQDMLRRRYLKVDKLNVIVIDEADEMFSSGFQEQVYKIFQYMPQEIQIGLFSATMDNDLEELSKQFMMNPKKILVNSLFEKLKIKFPIKSLIKKLINDIEKQTKIPEKIILCLLITYPLTIFYWCSFSLFYYNSTPDRI